MANPLDLINKFSEKENELIGSTVLAPVLKGATVRVRVGGVICELKTNDRSFEGFAILEVQSLKRAKIIAAPTLTQTAEYLALFPKLRLVLIGQFEEIWWGLMASTGQKRIQLSGPVPVRFIRQPSRFSTVIVRCDGSNFWYEKDDKARNPIIARHLRDSLEKNVLPENVRYSGMVPAEALAYHMAFLHKDNTYVLGKAMTLDERIREALKHSGAQLDAFWQRGEESITVRFLADGNTHICNVKNDLTLQSAGVCLRGEDQKFDLASLIGVLREGHSRGYDDEWQ